MILPISMNRVAHRCDGQPATAVASIVVDVDEDDRRVPLLLGQLSAFARRRRCLLAAAFSVVVSA